MKPILFRYLLALPVLVALTACQRDGGATEEGAPAAPTIAVEASLVALRPVVASYTGTATLEAEREAQVVAKTSGVLLHLRAEEGDQVRAGQVLARLDDERHRLELARAEANVARLENEFRRSNELIEARLTSQEAHDRVRYELDTQRALRDMAALELSYTDIVAPIDGVITDRLVKEGNLIQLNQPMFRVANFRPLLGVLSVPERELARLGAGLPVTMAVDALGPMRFEGKVARVSPSVDAATGTFRVTAEFDDPSGMLKAGMFGRLAVVYDRREAALTMSREALIEEDGRFFAFRVRDHRAERVPIRTGYASGGFIEVLEGLEEGDYVVTVGRAALRESALVQIVGGDVPPASESTVDAESAPESDTGAPAGEVPAAEEPA
ncbi:MAG TPA: efflux RND transporter periplasmic adaptor subunit [Xanthomonadaceae bacterium]|nr:efflux RND transporter periplasmic adaptor subunit [Xanthomonadaceae bacterium]